MLPPTFWDFVYCGDGWYDHPFYNSRKVSEQELCWMEEDLRAEWRFYENSFSIDAPIRHVFFPKKKFKGVATEHGIIRQMWEHGQYGVV